MEKISTTFRICIDFVKKKKISHELNEYLLWKILNGERIFREI